MINILIIMTGGVLNDGISITQLEYVKNMNKEGLSIDVLASSNNNASIINEFRCNGCNIIFMPNRLKCPIKYMTKLYKLIKKKKYRVIHVHGSSAIMAIELTIAKILNVPIRIAHSRNTFTKHPVIDKIFRPIFYQSYTNALACGSDAGSFLFRKKKFDIFYNGKDFKKFCYNKENRNTIRKKYFIENNIVLGFVGALNEQKNPFFLIDIFYAAYVKDPNLKLLVIGNGHLKKKLLDYVDSLNCSENVIFIGESNEVGKLIQACDIMLLPSLYEGLPNVVLEWQIAGLYSLVSNRVTSECKQTSLVEFLSIDNGVEPWVKAIEHYKTISNPYIQSQQACINMAKNGFEISSSCKKLRNLYLKGMLTDEL